MFVEAGPDTVGEAGRRAVVAAVAGVIAGLIVGGIGGRILMRIAGAVSPVPGALKEAGFDIDEITVSGTIAFVGFVGLFAGVVSAVLYSAFRPWLYWAGPARGVVFGIVLFAAASASSDVMNPDNRDFFLVQNHKLIVALIAALFVSHGIVIDAVANAFDHRISLGDRGQNGTALMAVAAVGFVISAPLLLSVLFTNSSCDCEPSLAVGLSFVAAGVGTVLLWTSSITNRAPLGVAARAIGFAGLLGTLAFGLSRAIGDAQDIIP